MNDFVIRFANVNGTGSASANALFTKAVFRMGVPVTPKNIFPSNIQGLPTWYEVRVSEKGHLGRREHQPCRLFRWQRQRDCRQWQLGHLYRGLRQQPCAPFSVAL